VTLLEEDCTGDGITKPAEVLIEDERNIGDGAVAEIGKGGITDGEAKGGIEEKRIGVGAEVAEIGEAEGGIEEERADGEVEDTREIGPVGSGDSEKVKVRDRILNNLLPNEVMLFDSFVSVCLFKRGWKRVKLITLPT